VSLRAYDVIRCGAGGLRQDWWGPKSLWTLIEYKVAENRHLMPGRGKFVGILKRCYLQEILGFSLSTKHIGFHLGSTYQFIAVCMGTKVGWKILDMNRIVR